MRILKDKKGLALENAILFMMIIFSLCFLIASFALIGHYQAKIENIKITQKVELDKVGEAIIACADEPLFEPIFTGSYCVKEDDSDGDIRTFRVYRDNDKNGEADDEIVLLYIEVNTAGEVLAWRYSE